MTRYTGSCHCGGVKFQIETTIDQTARCNCTLCKRKGAVVHFVPAERFQILEGEDLLTLYQWNTGKAQHFFCKRCGIYPFHKPRTKPTMMGVNVGCIDAVDVTGFEPEMFDGTALT